MCDLFLACILTLSDHGAGSPKPRNCHWIIVTDVDLSQEETIDGYAHDHAFDSYPRRITVFVEEFGEKYRFWSRLS